MSPYKIGGQNRPFTYQYLLIELQKIPRDQYDDLVTLEVTRGEEKITVHLENFLPKGETTDSPVLTFTEAE